MRNCPNCGFALALTHEQVLAIYEAKLPITEIARQAQVSRQTVHRIKHGHLHQRITKHVATNKSRLDEIAYEIGEMQMSKTKKTTG
jgi:predicted DNA-binding protein YlxM (UPF0122 family)